MVHALILILCSVFMLAGPCAAAEEAAPAAAAEETGSPAALQSVAEETSPDEHYAFPTIPPEVTVFGGYRFVSKSGSPRSDHFEYLHDSVIFGGEARYFSFPHRFHLDIDFRNKKDYFGEASYAYEDLFMFRGINRTIFHNLDTVRLIDLNPATSSPGVVVRDPDTEYGVRFSMSSAFLRFKTHDYPLHVYLDGTLIDRSGTMQQRSLLGSGYFNNLVTTSQSRGIDSQTKHVTIGINSHLGPVELDLSHGEMRFNANGDKVLFDPYTAATSLTPVAAGVYPHNETPDYKGSSNTLKIHTSYTGSLVASATVTKYDRDNRDSGAKADYFIGAGEVSWVASPQISFFVKYRHKEYDVDVPSTVTLADRSNPLNAYTYLVESPISSMTDTVTASARLRPLTGVSLVTEYTYENVRRDVSFEWHLPSSTRRNTISVAANVRLLSTLSLKAKYAHKMVDDPAYNTEPERSDEGRLSLTWIPTSRITALLSCSTVSEKRDSLTFADTGDARRREARRNNLLGSLTFLVVKDLSLTASYAYTDNKSQQDIVYQDQFGTARVDPFVPFKDTAHTYAVDITYLPSPRLTLTAAMSYTIGSGVFYPAASDLLQPVSVASFSDMKIRETVYSATAEYRFKNGYAAGVQYRYSDFKDVLDNPFNEFTNGRAHIVLVTVSKKW